MHGMRLVAWARHGRTAGPAEKRENCKVGWPGLRRPDRRPVAQLGGLGRNDACDTGLDRARAVDHHAPDRLCLAARRTTGACCVEPARSALPLAEHGMPLSTTQRKSLAAAANRLPAHINVSPGALSDAVIAHIQSAFGKGEVLKIRVNSRDRDECELVGLELAEKIGGELVARVGHVVVLFRAREETK